MGGQTISLSVIGDIPHAVQLSENSWNQSVQDRLEILEI